MTSIREAKTMDEALEILKIRNEVRKFMTRHRTEIQPDEQKQWFEARKQNDIHLYTVESDSVVIGYGLIHMDGQVRSRGTPHGALTGAVTSERRGKGYGRLIFSFLLAETWVLGAQPWLEVLVDNAPAISLYHSLGFRETSRGNDKIHMMHFK